MLTSEQNDALTHVLPGTRMGRLLRRYWHPIAAAVELHAHAIKAVTVLGESLILFRDPQAQLGLVAGTCAHRGTALLSGEVEDQGLRCASHGWLFDRNGQCIDQPLEPTDPVALGEVRIPAYPVQELGGLIFAYLGPAPVPVLPRYDVLAWNDARRATDGSVISCNWLQVMENLLDPVHVEYLHGHYFADVLARKGGPQLQEFLASHCPPPMKQIRFDRFADGIIERHMARDEHDVSWYAGTPSFFPTTSLVGSTGKRGSLIFIVPIDDTHTWFLLHMAERMGAPFDQGPIPYTDVPGLDGAGGFILDTANGQDHMVAVTQGDIARRDAEHLGASDAGIVLYRELLLEQMEQLEGGQDPINVRPIGSENGIVVAPISAKLPAINMDGWSRQRKRWAARHAAARRS